MRLLDRVASCTSTVLVDLRGELYRLPGAGSFAAAVAECPLRYVLEPDLLAGARQIVEHWPDLLDPADMHLRVPAETMWVEWRTPTDHGGPSQQMGLLVEAAPDGRSGRIRSFWTGEHGPDAAQAALLFDLDARPAPQGAYASLHPVRSGPAGAQGLLSHLVAGLDRGWHRYFAATALGPDRIGEAVETALQPVIRDTLLFFAFLRLLHSQIGLKRQEIDRSRLNAARLRTGKVPLLDHVELSIAIGEPPPVSAPGEGAARSRARLHLVRGHLVRRRDAIFWRSPHLRGGGTDRNARPVPKTLRVRLR
jgi:hypothetical protein